MDLCKEPFVDFFILFCSPLFYFSPSQGYGFSSGHVWIWELGCKESWAPKNWCFWTVVLEKTLESPLDYKEIQPVHPKGNKSWIFIGSTDAEAKTPILWPPDVKTSLNGKEWWQRTRWLDSITDSMDMNLSKLRETVKNRAAWHAAVHKGIAKSQDRTQWLNSNNNN